LIDTDPVVKANTRDALHVMRVREESARANRRRLKRVITIVGASLIVSFFAWRVLVLY
jgi:hypothetical protein